MKNITVVVLVSILVALGAWYLLSSHPRMLESLLGKDQSSSTPSIAPQQDIDSEIEEMDEEMEKADPDEFSSDALLEVNLGL